MKRFLLLLLISIVTYKVLTHSTVYHSVAESGACYNPQPAIIYSWHIHLIYWNSPGKDIEGALDIRDKFKEKFKNLLGPQCKSLFHQDYSCMFQNEDYPAGPFKTAQWAAFVTLDNLREMMT